MAANQSPFLYAYTYLYTTRDDSCIIISREIAFLSASIRLLARRPRGGKTMKKYELMYIVKADLDEAARKAEIEKLHAILTNNGAKIGEVKEWGMRNFAYEINKQIKGYYVVVKLTAEVAALNEFSRLARINPNVVRHLFTVED